MSSVHPVFAIARADFIERVRRYSFFVTLVSAVFLGYAAATGKVLIKLGEYRGVYTSAWIGAMVALVTATFVSLIGFYVVKNSVERDRQTAVGQILATTPLSKPAYTMGKVISNFMVLAAVVLVLALAAVVVLIFFREDPRLDIWALLSPFIFITLPAMALTAAMAVLFEVLPLLRGGVGNVLWFFLWAFGISLPVVTGSSWLDPAGLEAISHSMMSAARAAIPGYTGGFSLTVGDTQAILANSLRWPGVHWTAQQILLRIAWIGIAIAFALLAAVFFDRFDPARLRAASGPARSVSHTDHTEIEVAAGAGADSRNAATTRTRLTPLSSDAQPAGFGRLLVAELRLALNGLAWWWYAVAAGLLIAQLASPLDVSRGPLLASAWIWPLFAWSAMGTRESRYGTTAVLFSCPRILFQQLPALFCAGVILAAAAGSGAALKLLIAGKWPALVAWFAGVFFVPALALACGVWTESSKLYEALFTVLWYVGCMNRVPGLDYTGAANGPHTIRDAFIYFALTAMLLFSAFAKRAMQLRGV